MQQKTKETETLGEDQLKHILATRTNEINAILAGMKLALRTPIGLVAALAYGIIGGLVGHSVVQAGIGVREAAPAMTELWGQVTLAIGALASIYGLVHFSKRDKVSRASWWPALFAAPALLLGAAFQLEHSGQGRQLGPLVLSMFLTSWSLVWMSFGGAACAIVWVRAGHGVIEGESTGAGEIIDEIRTRLLDVAGPHSARVHAVTIGMQFLLPGIFYALQLAFTDMIAVLDPERPVLQRAGQLSTGMRGRLFRLMLLWWVIGTVVTLGISMPLEGVRTMDAALEKLQELFLDPAAPSQLTVVVTECVWAVFSWVLTLSLLVLYLEREGQVRAKVALKKLRAAAAAEQPRETAVN